jgi:hypothetical protein
MNTYRADRRTGVIFGLVFGLVVMLVFGLGSVPLGVGVLVVVLMFGLVFGLVVVYEDDSFVFGLMAVLELGLVFGLALGLVVGLAVSLRLTEVVLTLRGRGRMRFVRFFEDALDRQVLRQAGAVYQFRHAELQDHLAARYREEQGLA